MCVTVPSKNQTKPKPPQFCQTHPWPLLEWAGGQCTPPSVTLLAAPSSAYLVFTAVITSHVITTMSKW